MSNFKGRIIGDKRSAAERKAAQEREVREKFEEVQSEMQARAAAEQQKVQTASYRYNALNMAAGLVQGKDNVNPDQVVADAEKFYQFIIRD